MIGSVLPKFAKASAAGTMVLRGGIVALNFALMIGLATLMGLSAFGELAVMWGLALVVSTVLSFGSPLMLLRSLTDGGGLHPNTLFTQVMVLPVALAIGAFVVLNALFPALPWVAILSVGLGINLIACLASIMRALGSVQASMALRDAGPPVALALAAIAALGSQAPLILMHCVIWLGTMGMFAGVWCVRHARWDDLIKTDGTRGGIAWPLWGTSVLGMGLAQIDIIIGGSILSSEQIGLFVVLRRVANLVALPVSVATWVSAGPVSAAHGADNLDDLRRASAAGSQIAFIPGVILFGLALAVLPVLHLAIGETIDAQGRWVFLTLLFGGLIQVVFAASFTVATLCGQAHLAAMSRLISIFLYLCTVWVIDPALIGPLENALIYVGATSLGIVVLWWQIRKKLQVETSALVLLQQREGRWKLS